MINKTHTLPEQGYGLFKVAPEDAQRLAETAIDVGYRGIDTAHFYQNETELGKALRATSVDRDDLFITSKLWNADHGAQKTRSALQSSLKKLQLDYIDLYLIHWPCPKQDLFVESYNALEQMQQEGFVRHIGISNFLIPHMEKLLKNCNETPYVNQIEIHPYLQQHELRQFNAQHGIISQAHSPLGRGNVFEDVQLADYAAGKGLSVSELVLAWHHAEGTYTIPKASSKARMQENLGAVDIVLDDNDITFMRSLDCSRRFGSHPDKVEP